MRRFVIIATRSVSGSVEFDMEVRIVVAAGSLTDAYKKVRKFPEFKTAYLREE